MSRSSEEHGGLTRRDFLVGTGAATLALSLNLLRPKAVSAAGQPATAYPYTRWEDLYRQKWTWDKVVKGTHTYANCAGACAFNLYVKSGIVWREEQVANYPSNHPRPDFNPRGCQKGACYSELMYNTNRLKYPLKRVGERGEGRWKRISWDEALTEISDRILETIQAHGPEAIVNFYGSNLAFEAGASAIAKLRFMDLIGGSFSDTFGGEGDSCMGAAITWGFSNYDGTSDDWFNSDYLILWNFNPVYTRIPEAHFLWEARYNGAQVVSIAPDYNASSIHASLWVNPRVGSDSALALGMAHVIVQEKLYKPSYIAEQTDLPFLIREDTRRFLREKDLKAGGGREDVFYLWDRKKNRPVTASRKSLRLGALDPALEGSWEVKLADGKPVKVRTVFGLLRERLEEYSPEKASRITGVHPETIRKLGRDYARAKAALIISSMGSAKFYHADLMHRTRILLAALCGHTGKPGGGFRTIGVLLFEGHLPLVHPVGLRQGKIKVGPGALWWYIHGGLREVSGKKEYGDTGMKRSGVDDYVREALEKGWIPVFPQEGKTPKILFDAGGNVLRRVRANHLVKKHLWPKLDLIVDINVRIDSTACNADIVLPAASWYEKSGFKYTLNYVPYLHYGDQAVEPLYESKDEWEIFKLLAKKLEQRAVQKGFPKFVDSLGISRDLGHLYRDFTDEGKLEKPEAVHRRVLAQSSFTKGLTLEHFRTKGFEKFLTAGNTMGYLPGIAQDKSNPPFVPCRRFVLRKEPWPTLTGRQQFYIDHDWYFEFGEELPTHKDAPKAGGHFPLRITGGHTRWSIHSIWRDDPYMLRLQRGMPILYMNPSDAQKRGIADHDRVRVYNDLNNFIIHAKLSPTVQPGQTIAYHAWEPLQYEGHRNHQVVMPSPFKPLHLVGNYGHLGYRFVDQQPNQIDRDTVVEVEKV